MPHHLVPALALLIATIPAPEATAKTSSDGGRVTVFGGPMTGNKWAEIAAFEDITIRDSGLIGGAYGEEIARLGHGFGLEWEIQGVRHFGEQDHWEMNALLSTRWDAFPWSETMPTSIAFGAGPSLASRVPAVEKALNASSNRLLLYWMAEIEAGLPDRDWRVVARLHHRSNAYGIVAEDGGSNALVLGIRWRLN